jgi:BlaI family penicillinase repressor
MEHPPAELTEAEWTIIKAVWEREPCTAPDIQERLHAVTAWTYSTVRTLMDRMVGKGLLRSEKLRNLTQYRSVVSREQAQRGELLYALTHAFDGAVSPMVQRLIETRDLSATELDEIEALLRAKRKRVRRGGGA